MSKASTFVKYAKLLIAAWLIPATCFSESCLWKAVSSKHTLYLQGSIHLLKPENYPLAPAIEQAYAESETIFFEANLKEMQTRETQDLLLSKAMYPEGRTLKTELSPEIYAQLAAKLKEYKIAEATVLPFKPWFVSIMIMGAQFKKMGMNPELGLDQHFYTRAEKDRKAIGAFETVEFQFSLFESLSDENEDAYTRYFLKELDQNLAMLNDIISAWHKGEAGRLNTIFMDGFKEYPELYKRFVTQRNNAWIEKIIQMPASEKPVMIVVGVAHLTGKGGLIEQLKIKGYTIEQL